MLAGDTDPIAHALRMWTQGDTTTEAPTPRIWETPGQLAAAIDRTTVQTPALDLIDGELVRAWNTPDARLIVCMPPQEGKSTRVTKTFPLWALLQNPETRVAIASYSQDLADDFGRDIRNWIVTNDGDEDTLDLGLRLARDHGAASRWRLDGHRGGVYCVGITGSLTGKPADMLIIDDPLKDQQQADSKVYRDLGWNFWRAVGGPRLAPGAPVIVILTRWHEDDLAGRLLAAEDGHLWRVVNVPALADHDPAKGQADPLGREPGQWLVSARARTVAQWEAIRVRSGTRVFTSLYQGRPSPEAGDVWQRSWWRRYHELLWTVDARTGAYRVDGMDEVLMSWDMAFKDTKASDWVVGQVWARRGAEVFLLDQIRKRLSFTATVAAFKALVARWPQATTKLVEDKANGTAVIDQLKKQIPGIVPVTPTESKYARAQATAPFIEAGNVNVPSPDVALFDVEELIEEAAAFPNGAHDDQVDGTSQALARLLLRAGQGSAWLQHLKDRKAEQDAQQDDQAG